MQLIGTITEYTNREAKGGRNEATHKALSRKVMVNTKITTYLLWGARLNILKR